MKIPKPKFKKGDKIIVDNWQKATIKNIGIFKKNGKIFVAYQLTDNPLAGFWANENRVKTLIN